MYVKAFNKASQKDAVNCAPAGGIRCQPCWKFMISIPYIKLCFDRRFRKKKFARIIFNGVKLQILSSLSYVKYHIHHQNEEMNFDKNVWKEHQESINEKYKLLNGYGYKGRGDYFDSCAEDDPELELLDIIADINRMAITKEDEDSHIKEIDEYVKEIEASDKILQMLEKMAPIVSLHDITTAEGIDDLFKENECSILLSMPSIINYEQIFSDHYYS